MGNRKQTPAEIFSWTSIAVSLALLSGMAMGHVTRDSMHARLSATPVADPVERYALGQNAYDTANAHLKTIPARPRHYADAGHEIGRYKNGVRLLAPAEPARKSERLRLERLQDWNEQSFGGDRDDQPVDYAEMDGADYPPIDVGAVTDAPESEARHAVRHINTDSGSTKPARINLDARPIKIPAPSASAVTPLLSGS